MATNDGKHSKMAGDENHGILSEPSGSAFADAAARIAHSVTADELELGVVVRQVDTGRDYIAIGTGTGADKWRLHGSGDGTIGGTLGGTTNVVPKSSGTGGVTVQASSLVIDGSGVASGITFADPSTAQQPATKAYADNKETVFCSWGSLGNPATTSPRWLARSPSAAVVSTAPGTMFWPIPSAGTISRIAAAYNNAAQATDNITYSIDINGINQALSCTLTPSVATAQGTGAVAVVPGDTLSVRVVQSGSAASTANCLVGISICWKSS